jgi:shikimate kinase
MGCGKSTLGKLLANQLKYQFVDSDEQVEKNTHMTIKELFEQYGESHFRRLEYQTICEISKKNNQVIATGGGVIKNLDNIRTLKQNGIIVYLQAPPERIYENVKNDKNRPLLDTEDKMGKIKKLLKERVDLYKEASDIIVDVNKGSIKENLEQILFDLGGELR